MQDWIYICKKVLYDEKLQEEKSFLASVVLNENQIDVIYCQGGGMDVEKYKLKVDVKKCFPQKIELPIVNFTFFIGKFLNLHLGF